jgi:hypothetical protein
MLATSFCYSQDTNINARSSITSFSNAGEFSSYGSGMWVSGAKDPGVDGTPYLFKNWQTLATIHTGNGKQYAITNLNYDTKLNRFVSKISVDSVFVFEPSDLKEAVLYNRKFRRYYVNNIYQYYQIIAFANGKEVLKQNFKDLKKGIEDPLTQQKSKSKYILKTKYFLNSEKGMETLKLKKKPFYKIFGDKASIIKKYVKTNNLSFRRDTDISKIFKYYDEL